MHVIPMGRAKQQAKAAYERKNYEEALAMANSVLEAQPGFADIRHLAGLCLNFLGRPEESLAEFEKALATNPRYVEAHINRALTLQELGRYHDAREAFERASNYERELSGTFSAAVSARLANSHAEIGDLYAAAGAPGLAAEQYRRALALRPGFHDIRNKLAVALLEAGDSDAAGRELTRVLDANPHFLAARINLGLVHYRHGDISGAIREWHRCASEQPDNAQVRAFLAMVGRHTGASAGVA